MKPTKIENRLNKLPDDPKGTPRSRLHDDYFYFKV